MASSDLAARIFASLKQTTSDPPGVTRASYGAGEQQAHDLAQQEAERLGLEASNDAAGNLYLTWRGSDPGRPAVMVGSHMDSVPHGGNFDGAAGVVAGLAAVERLQGEGARLPQDLVVMAIRAEESTWFPASYIGSRCALGLFPPDLLDSVCRSDTGRSLAAHMADLGFDPAPIRAQVPQIDKDRLAAFLEIHIEQGPVLVERGCPVGLVTGIRGSFRYRHAKCFGSYAHSGATPLALRRDAVLAVAELITALQGEWDRVEAEGGDLTVTFGQIATDPDQHAFSKVAGEVSFCLDVRSQSVELLGRLQERTHALCAEISARRNVQFDLGGLSDSTPAIADPGLLATLESAARQLDLDATFLASGAGHDAAVFANAGIPAAMIFVRNQHGSHNPDEDMDLSDFDAAVALLCRFLIELG